VSDKRKVKRILINRGFQLKIMSLFGLLIFAVTITYASAIYFVLEDFIQMGKSAGLSSEHVFYDFIARQKLLFLKFFVITSFGATVIFLYVGFVLSHRIAGPMARFKNHLNTISSTGDFKPIKFRDNDFFQDVADSFNKAIKQSNKSD